jgi:hypothetical protein
MENQEKIQQRLTMQPFRPFWITTRVGTQVRVERPEWYWEPLGGFGEFAVFDTHGHSLLNFSDVSPVLVVETPHR